MKNLLKILLLAQFAYALNYSSYLSGGTNQKSHLSVSTQIEHFWELTLGGAYYIGDQANEQNFEIEYLAHSFNHLNLQIKASVFQLNATPEFLLKQSNFSRTLFEDDVLFRYKDRYSNIVTSTFGLSVTNHNDFFFLSNKLHYNIDFEYSRSLQRDYQLLFFSISPQFLIPIGHFNYLRTQLKYQTTLSSNQNSIRINNALRIPFYRFRAFIESGYQYERLSRNVSSWTIENRAIKTSNTDQYQFFIQLTVLERFGL